MNWKYSIFAVVGFISTACVTDETTVTIGFGSCNEPNQTDHLLPTLSAALDTLDTYIWLGDNIYLQDQQWDNYKSTMERYNEVFGSPVFQEILGKTRHLAIWDDHDAGPNDCDLSTFSGFSTTMRAFKDFWQPSYYQPDSNSYYGRTTLAEGRVEIYLLDNRSFRTDKDSFHATVFGVEQLNWFHNTLQQSTAEVHLICMGGQLLNTAQVFENMSNYPHEREILLQWLSEAPGAPIVLTGDRHSGEINAIEINGKKIVEACASPITANAHPHHDEENTTRVHEGTTDTQHFGTLRLNSEKGQWNISVSLIDSEGVALFQYNYEM